MYSLLQHGYGLLDILDLYFRAHDAFLE
jgi:hypothetical protein